MYAISLIVGKYDSYTLITDEEKVRSYIFSLVKSEHQ